MTFLYFLVLYTEEAGFLVMFFAYLFLYLPILLPILDSKLDCANLVGFTTLSFCVGFVAAAFVANNNIWPIALVVNLALSIPSMIVLVLICKKYDSHSKALNTDASDADAAFLQRFK